MRGASVAKPFWSINKPVPLHMKKGEHLAYNFSNSTAYDLRNFGRRASAVAIHASAYA
jgi:hypothetical protein